MQTGNLYLIGFMGSGKSTLGLHLAKATNLKFIDLDKEIEKKAKKSISEIFEHKGEKAFRKMENSVLKDWSKKSGYCIALGGGTACQKENQSLIDFNRSVYLICSVQQLINRLWKDRKYRPLVSNFKSQKELKFFITKLLKVRKDFYQKAKIRVRNNAEISMVVARILRKI